METPYTAIVVGGGVAGLAAAHRLARVSRPGRLILVEAGQQLGGKIVTERRDGFVVEGGPDCFLAAKPAAIELRRLPGLDERLQGANPHRWPGLVRRRGRLYPLPAGLTGLVPSRVGAVLTTRLLSLPGRLRAGLEFLVPPRIPAGDETIAGFVTRRFGREAYQWLAEPLLGGIHAGDGDQLSLAATFPQLADMERVHGGVLRAMLRPQDGEPAGALLVAPRAGMAELVEALASAVPSRALHCGTAVAAVRRDSAGYAVWLASGERLLARAVILATPAHVTATLCADLDPVLAAVLREIPFVSIATVSLAYPTHQVPRPLRGTGYVSPRVEGGPVVACSWTTSKFAHRAPDGMTLLRVFLGRAGRDEDRTDDEVLAIAREEVRQTLGIRAAPRRHWIYQWPRGLPQYTRGHLDRIARIDDRLAAHPGLWLAGASYRGVGVPDCVASGWRAADRLRAFIGAPETDPR